LSDLIQVLEKHNFEENYANLVEKVNRVDRFKDKLNVIVSHDDSIIIETEDESKLMLDPRTDEKYLKPNSGVYGGLEVNSSSFIRVGDNPTAMKILGERQIDISDQNIKFSSVSIDEFGLANSEGSSDLKQADAGFVEIIPNNSMALKDIDVDNIPDNEDIIIDPERKKLVLIGKKVALDYDMIRTDLNIQDVSNNVFEEYSEEEIQRKYTYFFDFYPKDRKLSTRLRRIIIQAPIIALLIFIYMAADEYFDSVNRAFLFEKQQMKRQKHILILNERKVLEKINREIGVFN